MKKVMNANGKSGKLILNQPFLDHPADIPPYLKFTVQQALSKWYNIVATDTVNQRENNLLFKGQEEKDISKCLQTDLELVPGVLMDEMINNMLISDKEQYIRLVQALLVNLNDVLVIKKEEEGLLEEIEKVLLFIQNFFYQYFDFEYRVSAYCEKQLQDNIYLKLSYWKIKLHDSPLIDVLQECVNEKMSSPESYLSFRKLNYLKNLFQHIEQATTIINEEFVRELFITYNFNTACFIEYEIGLIREKLINEKSTDEIVSILQNERKRVFQLKIRHGIIYESNKPSVKQQLNDWITQEIKNQELSNRKKSDKDLQLDPEAKIQTSLSVAKLAVLIRLMVADKIIINKSVAPMLRTIAKLFTTLQKDEISFGSLETKYHAPDKATLGIMKEIMQKWAVLSTKL